MSRQNVTAADLKRTVIDLDRLTPLYRNNGHTVYGSASPRSRRFAAMPT